MKKVKFKNFKIHDKNKVLVLVIMTFLLVTFLTNAMINAIYPDILKYALKKVNKENNLILKDAFSKSYSDNLEIDNLLDVVKNSKEEIVEVDFDMKESYRILSSITRYMNERLREFNFQGYILEVPIGFIAGSPLFANFGPKIPIKVELADIVLGNVRSVAKPFGINMAQIEVYIDISVSTSILYPFGSEEETTAFSSLIASHIIAGKVPDFYGGALSSKSETLNIPLSE